MPANAILSQWIGVGGFLWPSYLRMILIIFPYFTLRNRVPSSAYAADATMNFNIPQKMYIVPFISIGYNLLGFETNIQCTETRIQELVSDR